MYDLIFTCHPGISPQSLKCSSPAPSRSSLCRSAVPLARGTALLVVAFFLLGGAFLRAQSAEFLRAQITVANSANNGLYGTFGVAVDSQGNVYISDWSGRLLKETPSGVGFGGYTQSVILSGLSDPNHVAVDSQENVYLADSSGRVLKETPSGGTYLQTVIATAAANGITQPSGVAVDQYGNVYVSDFTGGEVYKETLSAGSYTQSAVTSTADGLFEPSGVAVDANGNVFIADIGNNRVVEEKPSGSSYVQSVLASGLNQPFGVSVDSGGNVYIADSTNNRILKETLSNGSYVQSVLVTGLTHPDDMAIDTNGNLFIADTAASMLLEEKSSQVDFGPVSVGGASSTSIALTFQFSSTTTLNSKTPYQILTMGAPGEDFTDAGSATCTATTFSSGSTCVVNVTFSPKLAGTRNGAVILMDSSGNEQGTAYIAGTGQAPQIGYLSGVQTVIVPCCTYWPAGVAVDGNGAVYVADQTNDQVLKETPSSGSYGQSVVANATTNGLSQPDGVAVDGAGDIYIADPFNDRVLKMTPASSGYAATELTSDCHLCHGVAVDGSGNVYVADSWNNRVLKETLANGSYTETVIANSANNGIGVPYGVAADGNGNVYIADTFNDSNYAVFKETLGPGGTYTQTVVADAANGGLDEPYALAVDGVGDIFIADKMNYRILRETPLPGGKYEQIDVAAAAEPQGVAVDGSGNLYFSDPYNHQALLVAFGSPPVLSFGTVEYGHTSGVEAVQVVNNGNETLQAVSPGMSVPPGFMQVSGSGTPADCTSAFSLTQGAECNISIDFSPMAGIFGSTIGYVLLTDDNLNATSLTQAMELTATAVKGAPVITWATPTAILQGTPLSATQLNATANLPGTFVYTPAAGTVLALGQQTLTATFTPTDTTDYNTATATVTIVVYPPELMAGTNEWVWMGGSSTLVEESSQNYGVPGVYGSEGVAAPANVPGGRGSTSTWTDSLGNFWLFGGWGYDSVSTQGELNDLWEFSPGTQEWAWMSGSSTMATNNPMGTNGQWGVYGTLNTPASTNVPGGRDSASSWIDTSGNFWLFGGEGIDSQGNFSNDLNDLWEYSPSTQGWTWRGGNSVACVTVDEVTTCGYAGVYTSSTAPLAPGSRMGASSWTDGSGNFWLFGGNGIDSVGAQGDMNDLWEYSPTSALWTWKGGSSTVESPGNYSTDVSAPLVPSARDSATAWVDKNGNFWLFGGEGVDSTGTQGILNDLWEYVPSTGLWTWMSGSSTVPGEGSGQPGVYGSLNVLANGNTPGGRWAASGELNTSGNLILFGGLGFDSGDTLGDLNDAWVFNLSLKEWVWKGGQSTVDCKNCGWPGVYGALGVPAAANTPGGRYGSSIWTDGAGNSWLFGGSGDDSTGTFGWLNDLWTVGTPAAQPTFNPLPGTYAQSESVTISDTTPNAVIYYTADGSAPTVRSTKYTGQIEVSQSETINAIATASGYIASPVASGTYTITLPALAITWPTPAPITYGTALSSTQLDATANVAGNFVYSPAAGTLLTAGNQTLSATFTPSDTTDYKVTTVTVSLTVNPASPTIAWANPAAITYGTALSATQLDATANVVGTFAYTPAAGTVLTSGTQTLTLNFTPADKVDYTVAQATVQLTVNRALLTVMASNISKTYGADVPELTYTVTGFVHGDTAANSVTGSPALSTPATARSGVGTYPIAVSIGSLAAANYVFTLVPGSLVILPSGLTVTAAANLNKVYGAAMPALTYTITGFVNGDTPASAVTGAPALSTTATTRSGVGSYRISISAGTLAAANYNFTTFVPGMLTVTPAVLTVTAAPASANYNQPLPNFTYTITGYVNGDTSTVVSGTPLETTSAHMGSAPGNYPITISQGTLFAVNYSFAFVNGTLTISSVGRAPAPKFSPKPGISLSSRTVTITDKIPGAMIFYALHGDTPTMASHRYMGPIKITSTETIKAIAVVKGYSESDVTTVTYTIE